MAQRKSDEVTVSPQRLARAAQDVVSYWTPERMSQAKPIPLPTVYFPQKLRARLQEATRQAAGARGAVQPVISEPVPADHPGAAPLASGFATKMVNNISVYPYAVVCKLFMSFGNDNFVGSAWAIGESAVFTAGHCVHDRARGWATNILVQSGYNNGAFTGSWVLSNFASLTGWVEEEDFEQDMAIGITSSPIRPTTGKAGYIANVGQIQGNIKSVGYPAEAIPNFNFNGERMWECDGAYLGRGTGTGDDDIMAMQNNMTGGCSGGPGFYERAGTQYAIWVNSFRFSNEPNILRSPYFSSGFTNLVQWMKDNGGD